MQGCKDKELPRKSRSYRAWRKAVAEGAPLHQRRPELFVVVRLHRTTMDSLTVLMRATVIGTAQRRQGLGL